jgi:hypothetical protein
VGVVCDVAERIDLVRGQLRERRHSTRPDAIGERGAAFFDLAELRGTFRRRGLRYEDAVKPGFQYADRTGNDGDLVGASGDFHGDSNG